MTVTDSKKNLNNSDVVQSLNHSENEPKSLNNINSNEVRVRFAPSPTGYLHVGGARTALYNYLFAKKNNGKFILRIEDTDQARSTEESLKMVIEDLIWLGLRWDEGPDPDTLKDMGPYGPYKQSQRLSTYKSVAEELIQSGKAYYCFMSDEEIEKQREIAKSTGGSTHVESPYESWTLQQAQEKLKNGDKAVVRFRTKHLKKDYLFNDLIRGEVRFPSDMVGDFVLLRSDGMPVYNFCCVVDDYKMKISHVLRAEEHLSNTLRQMMIYEGMNWKMPEFGHLSLILDEDRQKLSKRKGATSCHEFKMEGYLPQALKNFVALLGWSMPESKEILTETEMIENFTFDRINSAGAVFDAVKLKWMNSTYLRAKTSAEIWNLLQPFIKNSGLSLPFHAENFVFDSKVNEVNLEDRQKWQLQSVDVFRSYMETLAETIELYKPLSEEHFKIESDDSTVECLGWESSKLVLQTWKSVLEEAQQSAKQAVSGANLNNVESVTNNTLGVDYINGDMFLKLQDQVKEKAKVKGKFLFMPIRVAVIGKAHGTELKILSPLISLTSLIRRVDLVLNRN